MPANAIQPTAPRRTNKGPKYTRVVHLVICEPEIEREKLIG